RLHVQYLRVARAPFAVLPPGWSARAPQVPPARSRLDLGICRRADAARLRAIDPGLRIPRRDCDRVAGHGGAVAPGVEAGCRAVGARTRAGVCGWSRSCVR